MPNKVDKLGLRLKFTAANKHDAAI